MTLKDQRKILCISAFVILIFAVNLAEGAENYKANNISRLFMRVNPALTAKLAKTYSEYVIEAGEKFKQDPYVIAALIVHESTVNNKAVSKGGDYGLMQIHWSAHSQSVRKKYPSIKKAKDLFNAKINILYGTEIFAYCAKKTGSVRGGLLCYSAGNEKLANKVLKTVNELQTNEHSKSQKRKGK